MPTDAQIMDAVRSADLPPMDFSNLPIALDGAARLLAQDGLIDWDDEDTVAE